MKKVQLHDKIEFFSQVRSYVRKREIQKITTLRFVDFLKFLHKNNDLY